MVNLVLLKLNFILDSSFPCCAWLCCHTCTSHMFYASLPFCHCHAVASCMTGVILQFSSWAALFSLFLHFMLHLPSWGPFPMPIITIFLSWDLSHSLYMPSNPYTVPCITTRQGIFFTSLFLVMDAYSSSWFSHISYIFLLLIFLSIIFHNILLLLSRTFYLVLQYSFTYSADLFLSI